METTIIVVVDKNFDDKVKYLCSQISKVEWGGIIFFSTEGSIKDPSNLKIHLKELLPMDKGTGGATKTTSDARIVEFLEKDPSRLDLLRGEIHSHHSMGVFFSSVDNADAIRNTDFFNYYLSIVVDNFGGYLGKIYYKAKSDKLLVELKARDEEGNKFITSTKEVQTEDVFKFDCVFELPDTKVSVDDELKRYTARIIEEAATPLQQSNFEYRGLPTQKLELERNSLKSLPQMQPKVSPKYQTKELLIRSFSNRYPKQGETIVDCIKKLARIKPEVFLKRYSEFIVEYASTEFEMTTVVLDSIDMLSLFEKNREIKTIINSLQKSID